MSSIGERLKRLRLMTKKTLDEESKIFGVSLNSVYRWEHNLCVPRKSITMKIASYYNVPVEWILNGDGILNGKNGEEKNKCDDCILNPERNTEQKILKMIKKLSNNDKYKIIGYIEHMLLENKNE